jgi:RimJ/RimL family protein N-acetyltransferase
MNFEHVTSVIKKCKVSQVQIPIKDKKGSVIAYLSPIRATEKNAELLARWRNKYKDNFLTCFIATKDKTLHWLKSIIKGNDRILFFIEIETKEPIGQIGLTNFDFINKRCELDQVIRGVEGVLPGVMTYACITITDWAFETLKARSVYARVFEDNLPAINTYIRSGYKVFKKVPLKKVINGSVTKWVENSEATPARYLLYLEKFKPD